MLSSSSKIKPYIDAKKNCSSQKELKQTKFFCLKATATLYLEMSETEAVPVKPVVQGEYRL